MGDKQIWITKEAYEKLKAQAKKAGKTVHELATEILTERMRKEAKESP